MTSKVSFGDINLYFLGHSGFIIQKSHHNIVIDPFLRGAPCAGCNPEDINATDILITHGHPDHLGDAVEIAQNTKTKITAIWEVAQWCETQGATTVAVPIGCEQLFDWGKAIFRPALHSGWPGSCRRSATPAAWRGSPGRRLHGHRGFPGHSRSLHKCPVRMQSRKKRDCWDNGRSGWR